MVTEKEAKPSFAVVANDSKKVWLRLLVADGKLTTQFREPDQKEWKKVGESPLPATGMAKVGVTTGGGKKEAERFVTFKEFRIVKLK